MAACRAFLLKNDNDADAEHDQIRLAIRALHPAEPETGSIPQAQP